ncbi:flagellar hook assembly protein FlgD [Azonexus sp. IMCC34839]|uniref:flagellar hook assembly protein FlgD n=1 Tax=Azonexus sp. IMCC34839 TaxID=3133695 RepID=UPI00399C0BD0
MSTVNATNSENSKVFAALNGSSGSSSQSSSAADMQDNFLTLFVTQLKNQDPLNPMDNAQMTTQLAQISTLKGIEAMNTSLSSLLSAYNTSQALQAAGAIGSQILVEGTGLTLSGGNAQGGATLASPADSVVLTIKDASGRVVQTEELGKQEAGTIAFSWDGKNSAGVQQADGQYTFSVKATSGGASVNATPVQVGKVAAVVKSGSSFVLELTTGQTVAFDKVLQFM